MTRNVLSMDLHCMLQYHAMENFQRNWKLRFYIN